MAGETISFYNHTRKLFANSEVSLVDLKVMLLDSDAAFDATDTAIGDVSADEVDGNGWTSGGEAIANAAVTVAETNEAKLDGDDIAATATGGSIGPSRYAVIYDSGSGNLLWWIDFGGEREAGETTQMKFIWPAAGIARWTEPAA